MEIKLIKKDYFHLIFLNKKLNNEKHIYTILYYTIYIKFMSKVTKKTYYKRQSSPPIIENGRWRMYPHSNDTNSGEYRSYYQNGQLYSTSFYVNGKLHGEYTQYYMNGEVWLRRLYDNGI